MFGLLNLHKPAGCTSRDVVTRVSRLVGRSVKVGHAGTLDPLATGVLVVCVGPATRLVPLIHEHQKSYEAEFLLGRRSETDDTDGQVEAVPVPEELSADRLRELLPEFTGAIQQVPPAYSAVKINGQRAYRAARQGQEFELTAREVQVSRLELNSFEHSPLRFSLSIDCGTGTYIRSIGRDLARRLQTAAVMSKLVRTRVGPLHVNEAVDVDSLTRERLKDSLISPLVMLDHLQQQVLDADALKRLEFGQTVPVPSHTGPYSTSGPVVVIDETRQLRAIASLENDRLVPQTVFKLALN